MTTTLPNRAIRLPAVCKTVGLSKATVWRLIKERKFPPPFKIGKRAVAWLEGDIAGWLEERHQEAGAAMK
jgi:prophage regulatory protein